MEVERGQKICSLEGVTAAQSAKVIASNVFVFHDYRGLGREAADRVSPTTCRRRTRLVMGISILHLDISDEPPILNHPSFLLERYLG